MTQSLVRALALAAAIFAVTAADAHAGWHSSGGSSSGSWGGSSSSSSGSWGSHGGSRSGGLFSRMRARMHAHSSGGSSGGSSSSYASHGSWGGSHSSHGSWGSSGGSSSSYSSHGSWGSSGGSSSSSGGYVAPYAPPADGYYDGAPAPPGNGDDAPAPPEPPMARADSGVLTVSVPADARVYVNGARTSSTGAWRHYVSRGLRSGYKYAYEVRAELVRDGRTIEETKTVELRAGETNRLAFDLSADELTTTLTLKVPEGAKVKLSGAETTSTGPVRTFSTTQLQPGQAWSDYVIQVAWDNNGETVVKEQTITLSAGDSRTLEFGGAEKLAAAR